MVLDIPSIIQSALLLFIVMDPLGNVPIFYSVTKGVKQNVKTKAIRNAVITAFLVLTVFAVAGIRILQYFKLSFESFAIAGGTLLFAIGFQMVMGKIRHQFSKSSNFGVVPLGVPLIAGPGAITMTIIISQTQGMLSAAVAIIVAMVMMELVLAYCENIIKSVGTRSSETLTRIMGIILAVIAVQLITDGLRALF